MSQWIDRRRAGILLHISSLPGPLPGGALGEEAKEFIDELSDAGFSVWQFLPLGPTHGHGSPYEALSSFAGNPDFLDLRDCVSGGWLNDAHYQACIQGRRSLDVTRAEAAEGFWSQADRDPPLAEEIERFRTQHADWLEDYAIFATLKQIYRDLPWWEWSEPLRDRDPEAIGKVKRTHIEIIRQKVFEQYLFALQWRKLKEYAESRGVLLFGDLPIYVAHDSADVWANRQYFTLNESCLCEEVAGVPPDYFSETGQRWGNPLYRWEVLKANGFSWWVKRVQAQLERMHLMRIDHFRGLEAYWAIPGEHRDGRIGEWRQAPGRELLQTLASELGRLPLIAEDLGFITPAVHQLRRQFGLPGMKIIQFAFGGDADNPYLPHNHEPESVVYTGTHDNDTTLGWFHSAPEHVRAHLAAYLSQSLDDMPWPLIRTALASVARLAIIPAQDLLALGSEARLNMPSTLHGNWEWRLGETRITEEMWARAGELNRLYGRTCHV